MAEKSQATLHFMCSGWLQDRSDCVIGAVVGRCLKERDWRAIVDLRSLRRADRGAGCHSGIRRMVVAAFDELLNYASLLIVADLERMGEVLTCQAMLQASRSSR